MLRLLLLIFAVVSCSGDAAEPAFEVQLTRQGAIEQVAVQADGTIFICGDFDFVAGEPRAGVARLNEDGSLDRTFVPQNEGRPIAITLDDVGVLVLENIPSGGAKLIRLDNEGGRTNGVSASFDWGIYVGRAGTVQMRKRGDGSILIYGSNFYIDGKHLHGLAKLKADGSLDTSFAPPVDPFSFSTVLAVVENADGTFWVANQRLHQIDAEGRLLKTLNYFNVYNVVPLRDGKFLLGGTFARGNLLRIHADGSEDTAYIGVTNQLDQAQINRLGDGRLLVMSYPPVTLNPGGELIRSIDLPHSLNRYGPFAEQNGKVLLGNYGSAPGLRPSLEEANFGLARLNRVFAVDPTFSMPGGITRLNDGIESMAAFPDGSIIVAGDFDVVQGKSVPGIVKLTKSGEIDTNFTANLLAGTNSYTHELALEESGNVLIQGSDWWGNYSISTVEQISAAGQAMGRIIKGSSCDQFLSVDSLPQDNMLITTVVGAPCWINGIITPDYRLYSHSGQFITEIVLQREVFPPFPEIVEGGTMNFVTPVSSNAFLVGGDFTRVNGLPRNGLAKIKISGEVDSVFQLSAAIPEPAAALRLAPDRFAVLCNRTWNGSAELIIVDDVGTILGRFGMDGVDRIKAAHVRESELVILSSSYLPHGEGNSLSLCTLSLTGELLRKVDFGSVSTLWNSSDLEFQMIVEDSGSVLVAGAVSKPHRWSGVRRLSRAETSAFRLDVRSDDSDLLKLQLRSPIGQPIHISKSHDLRDWMEIATATATNSDPYEISYSSTIRPIFFRAEMNEPENMRSQR